jgi:hypothetical protein
MTNDPLYEHLREMSWRRKLTPAEEASLAEWLAEHPETQGDWDSEAVLNETLAALPDVPVSSNFTARVVETAKRETAELNRAIPREQRTAAWWMRLVPKVALAAVVLGAGLLSYNHMQAVRRAELAQSLTTVSQVSSSPSPEVLKDFDAITALASAPQADEELLKVMQ